MFQANKIRPYLHVWGDSHNLIFNDRWGHKPESIESTIKSAKKKEEKKREKVEWTKLRLKMLFFFFLHLNNINFGAAVNSSHLDNPVHERDILLLHAYSKSDWTCTKSEVLWISAALSCQWWWTWLDDMFPVIKQTFGFWGEGAGCVLFNRHLQPPLQSSLFRMH